MSTDEQKVQTILEAFDSNNDGFLNFSDLSELQNEADPSTDFPEAAYEQAVEHFGLDASIGLGHDALLGVYASQGENSRINQGYGAALARSANSTQG